MGTSTCVLVGRNFRSSQNGVPRVTHVDETTRLIPAAMNGFVDVRLVWKLTDRLVYASTLERTHGPCIRWHAWVHKMVDSVDAVPSNPTYGCAVTRNATGTSGAYVPPAHRNSSKFKGPASEKYETWNPAPAPRSRAVDGATKDVLDLK
jgi:NADH:ubiquinone oxidoreductase subunit